MVSKPENILEFKKKLVGLSFFSGAMGLDLGLESVGIETRLVSEIDRGCIATIKKNRPNLPIIGDIRQYTATDIRSVAGLSSRDEIDLMVGGPPCQAFSTAGKRLGFEDVRGNVFLDYIKLIIDLQPRVAIIENVRGLLSAPLIHRPHDQRGGDFPELSAEESPGGALSHILGLLRNAGFGVSFNLYNSANFGAPQKRERVILFASRDGRVAPYVKPTHSEKGDFGLSKLRTVRDVIGNISDVKHEHVVFPEKRLRYYRMLKPGQYWKHLPSELQKEAMGASFFAGGGKTGFLRRLPWDEPSPTLVTHPAMPATDLAHPEEDRPLSVQEYKKIQEFPDSWSIEGTLLEKYRQIGNAVPISLGKAVGRLILNHLLKTPEYPPQGFPFSRYRDTDHVSWEVTYKKGLPKHTQAVLFA